MALFDGFNQSTWTTVTWQTTVDGVETLYRLLLKDVVVISLGIAEIVEDLQGTKVPVNENDAEAKYEQHTELAAQIGTLTDYLNKIKDTLRDPNEVWMGLNGDRNYKSMYVRWMDGHQVSVAGILHLVLPSTDPFWVEGFGLSVISLATVFEGLPAIVSAGANDLSGVFRELFGLALAITGLTLSFLGDGIEVAWAGLLLAGVGALITFVNKALFDRSPLSPLRSLEEMVSLTAVAYSVTTLASQYS